MTKLRQAESGFSPLNGGVNGASVADSKDSEIMPEKEIVKHPDNPHDSAKVNVTLSSESSEMEHSDTTSRPGLIEETHSRAAAAFHLRNKRNASSGEQIIYSHLINQFGRQWADHVARGFGWNITFADEREGL